MEKITTLIASGDVRPLLLDDGEERDPEPLPPAAEPRKRPRGDQPASPAHWGLIGYGGL